MLTSAALVLPLPTTANAAPINMQKVRAKAIDVVQDTVRRLRNDGAKVGNYGVGSCFRYRYLRARCDTFYTFRYDSTTRCESVIRFRNQGGRSRLYWWTDPDEVDCG